MIDRIVGFLVLVLALAWIVSLAGVVYVLFFIFLILGIPFFCLFLLFDFVSWRRW